jgi:hypothetical protein
MTRAISMALAPGFVITFSPTTLAKDVEADAKARGEAPALDFKRVEIGEKDSDLRKLLKNRYNATVEELKAVYTLYRGGRVELGDLADCVQRFSKSGVELAETPAERVRYLELSFEAARSVEAIVQRKWAADVEPKQALLRAQGVRYDIEIELLRAREAAKAAPAP